MQSHEIKTKITDNSKTEIIEMNLQKNKIPFFKHKSSVNHNTS